MKSNIARRSRHDLLALAVLLAVGAGGCSDAVPEDTPTRNPQLVAILTPPGATSSELRRAKDGRCYFTAGPTDPALDAKSYLALLEDRGVRLSAMAGSAHSPLSTLNLYNFRIAVATSLDPLTVSTTSITDVDPRDPSLFRAVFGVPYSYPIEASPRRVMVRLGECADSWRTETILPKTDIRPVPFGIPRPANSVLARASQKCGRETVEIGLSLPKGCEVILTFVSPVRPRQLAIDWKRDAAAFGTVGEVYVRESRVTTRLTTAEGSAMRALGVEKILLEADQEVGPEADFGLGSWPKLRAATSGYRSAILVVNSTVLVRGRNK